MKTKRWMANLGLLACTLSGAGVQAQQAQETPQAAQAQQTPQSQQAPQATQAQQTAEGAQRFLAAVVKKGNAHAWFIDAQGKTNPVRGKAITKSTHVGVLNDNEEKSERRIEKQLAAFTVTDIDTQGPSGKLDACLTRIAKWELRDQLTDTRSWQTMDEGILIDTPILHTEVSTYELSPELASPHWIDWRNVKLGRSANGGQMTASFKAKNFIANLAFTGEPELLDRIEYAMKFLKMSCDDTAATGF
jgi:hypothetical protein